MGLETEARKLNRIERDTVFILLGFAVLFGIFTRSPEQILGLLLGGILMLANFHFLWRFVLRVFEKEDHQKGIIVAGLFALIFLFFGLVGVSLLVLKLSWLPFVVGTLALLVSIFWNSLVVL